MGAFVQRQVGYSTSTFRPKYFRGTTDPPTQHRLLFTFFVLTSGGRFSFRGRPTEVHRPMGWIAHQGQVKGEFFSE